MAAVNERHLHVLQFDGQAKVCAFLIRSLLGKSEDDEV